MDFDTILGDCKSRYKRFDREIEIKRKPKGFDKVISERLEEGLNPIITEIKFSSPSGKIRDITDPKDIAREMIKEGACGISVLTEEKYFDGSLKNLREVSKVSSIPVLRKDFIFDEAQIYESYYYGADSLLLISGFFNRNDLEAMLEKSREIGIEPLVEIHSLEDIEKAKEARARLYVINNRDKDTLNIDLNRSKIFSGHIDGIKISASGINDLKDLRFVLKYCDAALIGTAIMRASNIGEKVREFVYGQLLHD
jgi:indole-3-glycerol phosphate synthase